MSSATGPESLTLPVNLTNNIPLPRSVSMDSAPAEEEGRNEIDV